MSREMQDNENRGEEGVLLVYQILFSHRFAAIKPKANTFYNKIK